MRCLLSSVVPWILIVSQSLLIHDSAAQEDTPQVCPIELDAILLCLLQEGISDEFEACTNCTFAAVNETDACSVQEQDFCTAVRRCCGCSEQVQEFVTCSIREMENSECPNFSCDNVVTLEPSVAPTSTSAPTPTNPCAEELDASSTCTVAEGFATGEFESCVDCLLGEFVAVLRLPCTDQENDICQAVPTCCGNRCTEEIQALWACNTRNLDDPICPDFSCENVVLATLAPSPSPVITTSAPVTIAPVDSTVTLAQCQSLDSPWMECLNSNVSVNDSLDCETCIRNSLPGADTIGGCFSYGSNNRNLCDNFQVCQARCGVCINQAHDWLSCQADTLADNVCNVNCQADRSVASNGSDGPSTALVAGIGVGAVVLILGIIAFVWTKKNRAGSNERRASNGAKAERVHEPDDAENPDNNNAPRQPIPSQSDQQRPGNQHQPGSGGVRGAIPHQNAVATPVAMLEAVAIVEEEANDDEDEGNYQFKLQGDVDPAEATVNLPRGSSRGSGLSSSDNTPTPVPRSGAPQQTMQRNEENGAQEGDENSDGSALDV